MIPIATEKKSFLLYFDAYPSLASLPAAQRGELLLALYGYAISVAEGEVSVTKALAETEQLLPETQMAFRFMADAIRRDTEKWKKRQDTCRKAAQNRTEKPSAEQKPMLSAEQRAVAELSAMMKEGRI